MKDVTKKPMQQICIFMSPQLTIVFAISTKMIFLKLFYLLSYGNFSMLKYFNNFILFKNLIPVTIII